MKLEDLPDDFTDQDFMRLDKASLDAIPFVKKRWLCLAKGCTRSTGIRDYGLSSGFFMLDRNSKWAEKNTHDLWRGPNNGRLCEKHYRLFKRLELSFDFQHIARKIFDYNKEMIIADKRESARDALGTVSPIEGNRDRK